MTPARYEKPFLTVDEQVALLENRGLIVPSRDNAAQWLRRVGYYRLSGYWYPFRASQPQENAPAKVLDEFVSGATFEQVLDVYEFDRKLRLLTLDAIERVEVSIRFEVGHRLGRRGPFAHADPDALDDAFAGTDISRPPALTQWARSDHAKWLALRGKEEDRSKADFVKHFKAKYGLPLPVWVVTEILDFGGLSWLYGGLQQRDRDAVASDLGLLDSSGAGNSGALKDWLKNINYVRNICAHHSRFWNANIVERVSPRLLRPVSKLAHIAESGESATSRPYASLAILALLSAQINPEDTWRYRLRDLILNELPTGRQSSEMGFPVAWSDQPLWSS